MGQPLNDLEMVAFLLARLGPDYDVNSGLTDLEKLSLVLLTKVTQYI